MTSEYLVTLIFMFVAMLIGAVMGTLCFMALFYTLWR